MNPQIVFEDNQIIVLIKPYNIPVQADDSKDEDLLTITKSFIKQRDNKPGNVFLGLVHRLDRPTGGIMVFAKTSKAANRLTKQLKEQHLKKHYLCVINGLPQQKTGHLITYLKKDAATNTVKIVPKLEQGAKEAVLDYQVIASKNNLSLLDVNLITGRSHQIRVQMSGQLNCPLYGDFKYGDKQHKCNLALWAYQLNLVHPVSKQNMVYKVAPDYSNTAFKLFEQEIERFIN